MEERLHAVDFARLIALPEDDPERRRAEASPEFQAMRHMLEEFEQPAASGGGDFDDARDELERRLVAAGVVDAPARPAPDAVGHTGGSRRTGLLVMLSRPATRAGLAFAAVVVVIAFATWTLNFRDGDHLMRGSMGATEFRMTGVREAPGEVVLHWTPAPQADQYRVVFLGADLIETSRVEGVKDTEAVIRAGQLPAGLTSGAVVSVEVEALRGGDLISTTPARSIRLP